jgi:tetratricopeptide (TPR) repeat protein
MISCCICVERYSQLKEQHIPLSDDIGTNLATVYLQQGRYPEAERLFQSAFRSMGNGCGTRSFTSAALQPVSAAESRQYLLEGVALAQTKLLKNEEAFKSLLRALHLSPHSALQDWFNVAVVSEAVASVLNAKIVQRTATEINDAMEYLKLSISIFGFLMSSISNHYLQQVMIDKTAVQKHLNLCMVVLSL